MASLAKLVVNLLNLILDKLFNIRIVKTKNLLNVSYIDEVLNNKLKIENKELNKSCHEQIQRSKQLEKLVHHSVSSDFAVFLAKNFHKSKSQLLQDLVAAFLVEGESGIFIEFGAADGLSLSNTYMLENDFGWTGVLAEPAKIWHENLYSSRKCAIPKKCVWKSSGEKVLFSETDDAMLATISTFVDSDSWSSQRKNKVEYLVETISLQDLILENQLGNYIDYLSVDTEGSELEILQYFDFDKVKFGFISVEHNFTDQRQKIVELMKRNGYIHIFDQDTFWDDWYITDKLYSKVFNLV